MSQSMPRSIVRRDGRAPLQEQEEIRITDSNIPRRASRLHLLKTAPQQTDELERNGTDSNSPDSDTRKGNRRSPAKQQKRVHWLMLVGVGMILAIVLYLCSSLLWRWGTSIHDDWTYGITRTYHLEAVVGDSDSPAHPSHFIAMNIHGQVNIIEFPGGDAEHAKIYPGPHLPWANADKSVITLEIKALNGDHQPDLVIHIRGEPDLFFQQSNANMVMLKSKTGFQPMMQEPVQ